MVRVLVVADEEVPAARPRAQRLEVELLLSAGDLPWNYLAMLAAALQVPAAFSPGNHDPVGGQDAPEGFLSVDDRVLEVAGLRVAGLGGSVRYNDGPHQYTQDQYRDRARQLVTSAGGPVDILLTHAPPAGLGDESDPAHRGIEALHELLADLAPTWHLHGHIHPYGMSKPDRQVGTTIVRNVIPWTVLEVEPRAADPTATRARRSA